MPEKESLNITDTLETVFSDKEIDENLANLQTDTVLHKLWKSIKRFLWFESKEQKEAHENYQIFYKEIIQNNQTENPKYSWKTIATLQFLSNEYLEDMIVEIKKWKKLNKSKEEIKNGKKYMELNNIFTNSLKINTNNQEEINTLINQFEEYFFNQDYTASTLSNEEIQTCNTTVDTNTTTEIHSETAGFLAAQQESNPEITDNKIHKNFSNIKSAPYEKNPETWNTLCSRTAWQNCCNFGISAPRWNASDSFKQEPFDDNFITNRKNQAKNKITNFNIYNKSTNFADLHVSSTSQYWHRAVAFLNTTDNQRYVLDPYRNHKSTKPILLWEYQKNWAKIIEANLYDSPYKIV